MLKICQKKIIMTGGLLTLISANPVYALSEGCQLLNNSFATSIMSGGGFNGSLSGLAKPFHANEVITYSFSSTSTTSAGYNLQIELHEVLLSQIKVLGAINVVAAGSAMPISLSGQVAIPKDGTYGLYGHLPAGGYSTGSVDPGTITVSCSAGGNSAELLNGVSTQVNQIGQKSVNRLVGGRIRQLQRAPGSVNAISAPETVTTSGLSHQLNQQNGKNAGAPEYASGVWGNIALTHFGDHHRPTNMTGLQGTGVFGIDTRVMDNLVIGGAVNLEYASIDLGANDGEITSTAFGVSPYVSWQIDDIFSLTGLANISHIHSRLAEQQVAGVISETDMNGVRWNVAVNGDGFFTWDNWSLLTGIQLSYGQLWNFSTKNNAGARVAGSDAKSGSATFLIQPAYYWQYSRHLGLEPYLLAEYQYDFTMEKVTTAAGSPFHSNDEDQFRLGAGLNIFGGAFYSGNVEASAVVGREDYTEATISSNIRINF